MKVSMQGEIMRPQRPIHKNKKESLEEFLERAKPKADFKLDQIFSEKNENLSMDFLKI